MNYNNFTLLGDYIYQLHKKVPFYGKKMAWSDPVCVFSASTDKKISQKIPKFITPLKEKKILREDIDDLICVLGDWETVAEGIVFTSVAMYVDTPKNQTKKFRIRYDDITSIGYFNSLRELTIIDYDNNYYYLTTKLWNVYAIKLFLEYASGIAKFSNEEQTLVDNIVLPHCDNKTMGEIMGGVIYANVSNASSMYFDDKIVTPRGHGFAAEHANHLADLYCGKGAHIVGDDNAKNGADRIVDNVQIQSKYCASGSKCIQECFENGQFRYWNPDGSPMQIEVPSDMYEAAVQAMENRIQRGEVAGVTDPAEAKNIVRKGHFTYTQVKNIAKAGTVESITYDAASGAIIASNAFGVTAILTFATSIWNGDDFNVAIKTAAAQGLKVGGTAFITAVLAGQLSKAGLNSALVASSETLVNILGPKASAIIVNALRSGTNIYGAAAMKSAAKLLRGNAITGAVSFAVLSVGDIANIFRGRISGKQLFKNMTNTASAVAGGTLGWTAGATAGAAIGSVVPIIGTAIGGAVGGVIGALGGGSLASEATNKVLDHFIEDDAEKMVEIIQEEFTKLANEYLITQREAEHIVDRLQEVITGRALKDMFSSDNRHSFARNMIEEYFVREIRRRKHIMLPSQEQMQQGLVSILEDIADEQASMV